MLTNCDCIHVWYTMYVCIHIHDCTQYAVMYTCINVWYTRIQLYCIQIYKYTFVFLHNNCGYFEGFFVVIPQNTAPY